MKNFKYTKYIKYKIKVLESLSNDFSDIDGYNIAGYYWNQIKSELCTVGVIGISGCSYQKRNEHLLACKKELESKRCERRNHIIGWVIPIAIAIIGFLLGKLL